MESPGPARKPSRRSAPSRAPVPEPARPAEQPSFVSELKRRNVIRMAGLYLVASWLIVQVTATILPMFGAPEWLPRTVVMLLAVAFVPALVFSWVYELTPEGLKREHEVAPLTSITNDTGRRMDRATFALLFIAVAILGVDRFVLAPKRAATVATAQQPAQPAAAPAVSEKSIAVLPFANTSGDPANEYFSDGMSEELINALGRLQDLTVIGRSSSFQFKGKTDDAKSIGTKLGVAYLLGGSVRKAQDKVRIAVELVHTSNGANVWSETYDRDLNDIFAVQSEIALKVAGKLQSTLLGSNTGGQNPGQLTPDAPPSGSVPAYNALLQGNFYYERRTEEDVRRAIGAYQEAAQLDPRYALAHAKLVYARTELEAIFTPSAGDAREALKAEVREALATALAVDPESPDVRLAQGYALEVLDLNLPAAADEYRRAVKVAPQNPQVALRLAQIQSYLGEFEDAVAGYRHMLALDPLSARARLYLGISLARLGRYAEAKAALDKAIELQPQAAVQHVFLALVHVHEGRPAEAVATAKKEPDEFWRNFALAFAEDANGNRTASDQALAALIKKEADSGPWQIAQIYAYRKQPDEAFKWMEHAYEVHDGGLQQMRTSTFLAPYEKDPRYEAMARKVRVWPG